MKFHIVSSRENINKIAFLYNVEVEEIQKENRHIRNWDNLIPGTKLKIPVLSENLINEFNDFEPFIEDYYPKYDLNEKIEEEIYTKVDEDMIEEVSNDEYISSNNEKEEIKEENKSIEKKQNEIKDINQYQRRYCMIPPYPYVNPIVYPPLIYIIRKNVY
jgi:hypothetical protein